MNPVGLRVLLVSALLHNGQSLLGLRSGLVKEDGQVLSFNWVQGSHRLLGTCEDLE